ncbi:MAG: hypothetical protein IAE91_00220, partial [Ignavibacteriaceae bacterium]|nr:hypothetical protein [Ignavibacteriaceae bacterium]
MKNLTVLLILIITSVIYSQYPDSSYGNNSIVDITVTNAYKDFLGVHAAFQSTGKVLVVSASNSDIPDHTFHITRLTTYGSIDSTFGVSGVTSLPGYSNFSKAQQILVLPDDKILAVGSMYFDEDFYPVVLRFTAEGILDPTFGNMGVVQIDYPERVAKSIRFSGDGNLFVLIRGDNIKYSYLVKMTLEGEIVSNFGNSGSVYLPQFERVYEMTVQENGRILVTGTYPSQNLFAVLGITSSGQIDLSFGPEGNGWFRKSAGTETSSVDIIESHGKIFIAGVIDNKYYSIQALTSGGLIDPTFGNNGLVSVLTEGVINLPYTLIALPSGKLLLTGYGKNFPSEANHSDMLMMRFLANGSLDPEFGENGHWYSNTSYHDGLRHTIVDATGNIYGIGYRKITAYLNPVVVKLGYKTGILTQIEGESVWMDSNFDGSATGTLQASISPLDTAISYKWIFNETVISESEVVDLTLNSGDNEVILQVVFSTGDVVSVSKTISVIATSKNLNIPVDGALSSINNYFVFPSLNKNMYIIDSLGAIKYVYQTGGTIKSTPAVSENNHIYTGTNAVSYTHLTLPTT